MSDIDTAEVDSLKALDPNRPIREADIFPGGPTDVAFGSLFNRSSRFKLNSVLS